MRAPTVAERVGEAITTARRMRGWSVEAAAAEAAGISPMTWRRAEKGLPVRTASWRAIEQALGLPTGAALAAINGHDDAVADLADHLSVPAGAPDAAITTDEAARSAAFRAARELLGDDPHCASDVLAVAHWLTTGEPPSSSRSGTAPKPVPLDRPRTATHRGDTYDPAEWRVQPNGMWVSPGGHLFPEHRQTVQRVMAARLRLGLPERPEPAAAHRNGSEQAATTRD